MRDIKELKHEFIKLSNANPCDFDFSEHSLYTILLMFFEDYIDEAGLIFQLKNLIELKKCIIKNGLLIRLGHCEAHTINFVIRQLEWVLDLNEDREAE